MVPGSSLTLFVPVPCPHPSSTAPFQANHVAIVTDAEVSRSGERAHTFLSPITVLRLVSRQGALPCVGVSTAKLEP